MAFRNLFFGLALCWSSPAFAEDVTAQYLSIELNSVETTDGACRLSFLAQNGLDAGLSSAVFEAVLLDTDGRVDRLTLLDFGKLPSGRPRVRQFLVPQLDCAGLGQVLINGVEACDAGQAADLCSDNLQLQSRIGIEVIG